MAFFYDMDNPALTEYFHKNFKEEYDKSYMDDPEELGVELRNALSDVKLDIVLVYNAAGEKEVQEMMFDRMSPNETATYYGYVGDVLQALVAGTDTIVSDIEIKRGQSLYAISQMEFMSSEL